MQDSVYREAVGRAHDLEEIDGKIQPGKMARELESMYASMGCRPDKADRRNAWSGPSAMSGLSQEARDLLAVIRRIDSDSEGLHPRINRDEIDDVLGRAPGNGATRHALDELDVIGDLENVTRSGSAREPISFTLA